MTLPETRDYLLDELASEHVRALNLSAAASGPQVVADVLLASTRERLRERYAHASVGALRQAVVGARLSSRQS